MALSLRPHSAAGTSMAQGGPRAPSTSHSASGASAIPQFPHPACPAPQPSLPPPPRVPTPLAPSRRRNAIPKDLDLVLIDFAVNDVDNPRPDVSMELIVREAS